MAMEIPTDLPGILSWLDIPVAGALALGLVKSAEWLEADAKEERLKYISNLLTERSITSFGKVGAAVVPFVFEKVFGSKAFSFKFVLRSILASVLFWVILTIIKHGNVIKIFATPLTFIDWDGKPVVAGPTWLLVPAILLVDWLSLVKSKYLLQGLSRTKVTISHNILFIFMDVCATFIILSTVLDMITAILTGLKLFRAEAYDIYINNISKYPYDYLRNYLYSDRVDSLLQVFIPSTMLTSAWVALVFIATLLLKLLAPLEYLRRFTLWWFKDIDAHPLRAIAKVAATLIVVGAFALKIARWGWSVV
jgi:hypothetical protein